MMNGIDIFWAELRSLFAYEKPTFLLLLAVPLVYVMLFGYVYKNNVVKYVPTVIHDQNQTALSRAFVQAYRDSERCQVVAQVSTQEEMENMVQQNEAYVGISIPDNFAENIKKGHVTEVLVVTNSANNMFATAIISASQEIVQTLAVATGQKLMEAAQLPSKALHIALPIKMSIRILNNPATAYTNFMLSGMAANGVQVAILLAAAPLMVSEYRRSRWSNRTAGAVVAGKLLSFWLCSLVSFAAAMTLVIWYFNVPMRSHPAMIGLLGAGFTYLVVNITFLFSAISKDTVSALQSPLLYLMPGLLFSGLSWPDFAMNTFCRFFSALMPLTYFADTLRDLLLAGYAPDFSKNLLIMFGSGSVLFLLTTVIFAKRRKAVAGHQDTEAYS